MGSHRPGGRGGADRRGVAAADLLVVVAFVAFGAMLAGPSISAMRTEARLAGSQDNLGQFGKAHAAYAEANQGFIAGFDWEFQFPAQFDDPFPEFDIGCGTIIEGRDQLQVAQLQLAAILRKATGRCGVGTAPSAKIVPNYGRLPHRSYSHQPLLEWLGASPTDPIAVSPLDADRQDFQRYTDPDLYDLLPGGNADSVSDDSPWTDERTVKLWAYSSSYRSTAYAWSSSSPDANGELPLQPARLDLWQIFNDDALRPQRFADAAFPALKTHLFEHYDYSQGLGPEGRVFADPEATVNVLAFDGSVRGVATADANPGWDPTDPTDMSATTSLQYRPVDTRYERVYPPDTTFAGPHMWTRGGIRGIDFGAGEVNTTNDW